MGAASAAMLTPPLLLPEGCNPGCQGCRHRGWSVERSLAQKQDYLSRALGPWANALEPIQGPQPARRLGYRERVTLAAAWDAGLGWQFGLVRRARHQPDLLIPIHECPVQSPRIFSLIKVLIAALPPAVEFPLAYLHVAGAQVTLVVKAAAATTQWVSALDPELSRVGIEGLWLNFHPAAGRRLFWKRGWRLVWGEPRSRDGAGLLHGPGSFQQLLPELYSEAVETASGFLHPAPGDRVLDLYCGIGGTLVGWTRHGATALGVEVSAAAVDCARQNAPAASLLAGTCGQRLPQIRTWWPGATGRRLVWANPPRSGLEAEVTNALITDLRADGLAYLSCSAGTLGRDIRILGAAGYGVSRLVPFDFFPQTHHVEVLALLNGPGLA